MTSQTQSCKTVKKWKCNISGVFCLKLLQAVGTWQRNFPSFQMWLLWQPKSKLLSVIEKTKGLLFKQKYFSKNNLKQYISIVTAGSICFWREIGDILFLLWGNNSLLFFIILILVVIATKFWRQAKFLCLLLTAAKFQTNRAKTP